MEQTWRWFGPQDPVTLSHVRQAGATGIVSALHQHYRGQVWPADAIAARKAEIEAAGLRWSVVESIPIPNEIKLLGAGATAQGSHGGAQTGSHGLGSSQGFGVSHGLG